LPKGRLIQYYGPPGGGKTCMSMIAMKEAQLEDPTAYQLFIDAEGTFDQKWANDLGVNVQNIIKISGELAVNGRRCFEMLLGTPKENSKHVYDGKKVEGVFDQIISKKININLIVLDSLASIIPPGEDIAGVGQSQMARLARFMTDAGKKLSLEVSRAKIPMIIINHKRDSLAMYGPDHAHPGGNAYKHQLSANIYFEPIGGKDGQILDEDEDRIGQSIRATVEKSKFGPCPRKAFFKLLFTKGIVDSNEELFELALKYGIINKLSTVTYEYNSQMFKGKNEVIAFLKDESAFNEINTLVNKARDENWLKEKAQQTQIEMQAGTNTEEEGTEQTETGKNKKKKK
jgi:recombination protein RecA